MVTTTAVVYTRYLYKYSHEREMRSKSVRTVAFPDTEKRHCCCAVNAYILYRTVYKDYRSYIRLVTHNLGSRCFLFFVFFLFRFVYFFFPLVRTLLFIIISYYNMHARAATRSPGDDDDAAAAADAAIDAARRRRRCMYARVMHPP